MSGARRCAPLLVEASAVRRGVPHRGTGRCWLSSCWSPWRKFSHRIQLRRGRSRSKSFPHNPLFSLSETPLRHSPRSSPSCHPRCSVRCSPHRSDRCGPSGSPRCRPGCSAGCGQSRCLRCPPHYFIRCRPRCSDRCGLSRRPRSSPRSSDRCSPDSGQSSFPSCSPSCSVSCCSGSKDYPSTGPTPQARFLHMPRVKLSRTPKWSRD